MDEYVTKNCQKIRNISQDKYSPFVTTDLYFQSFSITLSQDRLNLVPLMQIKKNFNMICFLARFSNFQNK